MGSVKDLIVLEKPDQKKTGIGRFIFSDRYSVFDWGEMPDHIRNKGSALCIIGAYFFEKLEKMGIRSHYLGVVQDDKATVLDELEKPVNCMEIKLLRVIPPEIKENSYNYFRYQRETRNFLIPLEVIYRNVLPEGSSLFKRLKNGELSLEDVGLNKMPIVGERLKRPILEVSTKLEPVDRYISWEEAKDITGLEDNEIDDIKRTTQLVNQLITEEVGRLGLINEDGKLEFGLDEDRNLLLVDVLGTPDECRFTSKGIPVSKEIARRFYRKTDWYVEMEKAKRLNNQQWKREIDMPPPLPEKLLRTISLLYQSFCNELTGKRWFEI
ncbi:phosphoribosylaminoimidazolesuccinocarboxamide synthase [candidate division WOR-3 bacterium]|nr:phosphoribosylaminoimidazolesuccinocarboxamide synthase [candidate division WOR-3 bacterium]